MELGFEPRSLWRVPLTRADTRPMSMGPHEGLIDRGAWRSGAWSQQAWLHTLYVLCDLGLLSPPWHRL